MSITNMVVHRILALCLIALGLLAPAARADEPQGAGVADAGSPDADDLGDDLLPPLVLGNKKTDRGSISEELGTLQPNSSAENPIGAIYTNNLSGVINLTETWSLDLGFLLSFDRGSPPPPGSMFADSGGHVSLFTLGADWDSGNHWSLDVLTDLSPKTTTSSNTTLIAPLGSDGGNTETDARLAVTSSDVDLQLGAGYDTGGFSDLEWMFIGSVTGGHLSSAQQVTGVYLPKSKTTLGTEGLRSFCTAHAKLCGNSLNMALKNQDAKLDSLKIELGTTMTVFGSTDLSITGDYFLYAENPSDVGYYNIATNGRGLSGGAGIPIAPLRVDARLDLLHRFGPFSLKIWGSAGGYAIDGDGTTYGAGVKAQYKITQAVRVWLAGNVQHDVDDTGNDFSTWGVSGGLGYRF